jgi:outer membrane protein assembly factor BamB
VKVVSTYCIKRRDPCWCCGLVLAGCTAFFVVAVLLETVIAADWPQHLGPQRNGISAESGLLTAWPTTGLPEVWRVEGGAGMSGLAISQGRVVTMLQRNGKQLVVALDAANGTQLWQAAIGPSYQHPMGDGPRATPTVMDNRVYAFSGEGHLLAIDLSDGGIAWRHDTVSQHQAQVAEYGMACSPLVVDDHVIVTVGAAAATVAAYECDSGRRVWQAGQDDPAGYSSPALLDVGGRQQVVVFTGKAALGVDHKSGEVLWRYPYTTNFNCNVATPLAYQGQVFLSAGENHGSVLLSLDARGKGFGAQEVWESQGPRSVMRNEWQTSILLDGHLYGMDNVGGAGPITHLTCIEAATGKRSWQQVRFGKGNLIAADGKLFISTMEGELVVVLATPEKYTELGRAEVIGSTRQAPALANGLLYLRDDQEIVCLDVRARN